METLRLVLAGCFGLVIGSFLNVVIWRLPQGQSLVSPPSSCPGCGKSIRWFDNIPVFAWILLRGRCRSCKTGISVRYPLVEALTGGLFVLAAWRWPDDLVTTAVVSVALAALVAISFIDWDHKIIPDRITKPGIVFGVAVAPLTVLHPPDWIEGLKPALSAWLHAGAGVLAGALVILAIRFLGTLVFRKEAMGLGDVKLLAFIGAFVGPVGVLYALVLASVAGATVGVLRLLWSRGRPQRFGLVVRQGETEIERDRALIAGESVVVQSEQPLEAGKRVKLSMTLPEAAILEEEDAVVEAKGKVESCVEAKGGWRSELSLQHLSEQDRERLEMVEASWRYVPFGPFLAIGGAAVLIFGDKVRWLITEGYPEFARGLFVS